MTPRVLLLFTPPADPAQPYASLPALAAFLRAHDVEVHMADLNIEAVHHLLSPEHLEANLRDVSSWVSAAEAQETLDAPSANRYLLAVHAHAFGHSTIAQTPGALAALRNSITYRSMATYCDAIDVVDAAYRLVSAACHPTVTTRHKLQPSIDIWNPEQLWKSTLDTAATPFHGWLRQRVEALIEAHQPHIVGVSLTFPDQLPLAFLALSTIRAVDRGIVTCLGGATASRLAMRVSRLGPLASVIDVLVVGEGEAALLELARRACARLPLLGVPNTVCMTKTGPLWGPQGVNLPMDTLPVPLYAEIDLQAYLASEPVLLLSASRACYWGKCKFCDVSGTASERYRQRSLDRVVADFDELQRLTGARHFMFGDLAIAPERLARLGDRLRERRLDVRWLCQARLEAGFTSSRVERMAAGGCRLLVFGLESASQRVLDRMAKGTQFARTEAILTTCSHNGIAVNLQTFVGFPGETMDEARETVRFVIAQRHAITSVALTSFKLIEGTSAFEESSALGLNGLRQSKQTLDVLWEYEVESGVTAQQADALVDELYRELVQAFPAISKGLSWNAHALLLVSEAGPDALRRPAAKAPAVSEEVRVRPDVLARHLPFHVGEIASCVRAAHANGSQVLSRHAALAHTKAFVVRSPTWTLLDPRGARAVPLMDSIALILLGGEHPARALDGCASPEQRLQAAGELVKLLDTGLLISAVRPMDGVPASEVA